MRPFMPEQTAKSTKVSSVAFVGYEDVYNMEVDRFHNFSIEGGLIVHNCMDALRYGCAPLMRGRAKVTNKPIGF